MKKRLVGIFDTKINTPEEIFQKAKEVLENRSKQKKLNKPEKSNKRSYL